MQDEGAAAALRHRIDEAIEAFLRILVVDADAALDRDRHLGALAHRRDQVGDKLGLGHQAGAEPPRLHAIGRAADIEIDLVVTELGADARGLGKRARIAAADLQGNGMLIHMELEQPVPIAAQHGVRRHHLGVEQRALGDEPQEVAAVPVGPLHHGRDAEEMLVHIQ